jgi:DUF4097 and DUF4098 domain-containing protein YvlB
MRDEVQKILALLENGKINADEAERLISAVSEGDKKDFFNIRPPKPPKIPKDVMDHIGSIPDQVGQALSAAFGSFAGSSGRQNFPDAKKLDLHIVNGHIELNKGESGITIEGMAWPLKTKVVDETLFINSVSANITVEIPEDSECFVKVVNADINADGITGKVKIESVNPDIELSNCQGNWEIRTVNGDVEGADIAGQFSIITRNGDVELEISGSGEYNVETYDGDIEITIPETFPVTINAKSQEGDVEIPDEFSSRQSDKSKSPIVINAKSMNGDIEISE